MENVAQDQSVAQAMRSEQINELAAALAKAQAQIKAAQRTSENPFFKSSYADLASIWEACRKPLTDQGLSITQETYINEHGGIIMRTVLMHSSGQWRASDFPLPPLDAETKNPLQAYGSSITYVRRYQLQAVAGVTAEGEDDDAQASGEAKPSTRKPKTEVDPLDAEIIAVAEQIAARLGNSPQDYIKSASTFNKDGKDFSFSWPSEKTSAKWKTSTLNRLKHNLADLDISDDSGAFDKASA